MKSFTSTYDESSLKFDSKSAASIFYPMSLLGQIIGYRDSGMGAVDLAVVDTVDTKVLVSFVRHGSRSTSLDPREEGRCFCHPPPRGGLHLLLIFCPG